MRYYVKVSNGVVIDGPKLIPSGESEVPNQNWSSDQMLRWGFYEVDLEHDEECERIDYDHPSVTSSEVTYPRIQIDQALVLSDCKKRLIALERDRMINRIFTEYDEEEILLVALGVFPGVVMKDRIQSIANAWVAYKNSVNNSTSVLEAKSCVVTWP